MNNKLYTGFSVYEFSLCIIYRIIIVAGIFYLSLHYEENPNLILVLYIILGFLLLIIGDDQIEIYPDRITQKTNSLLYFFFKTKGNSYPIADIKYAHLEVKVPNNPLDVGVAITMLLLLPRRTHKFNNEKPIYFDLKAGTTLKLSTNLEDKKRKEIVDLVNKLVFK